MSDMIKHILSEDFVAATKIFESKLDQILEKKLYETKRRIQAEAFGGGLTTAEIEARRRLGWKKASDVLPDPRDYVMKIDPKSKPKKPTLKKGKKLEEEADEAQVQAAMKKLKDKGHPGLQASARYTQADRARRKHGAPPKPTQPEPEQKPEVSPAIRLRDLPKKRTMDDYRSALATAKNLRKMGHSGDTVGKVKRAYAGVRAKHKAKGFVKDYGNFMGKLGGSVISGLASE